MTPRPQDEGLLHHQHPPADSPVDEYHPDWREPETPPTEPNVQAAAAGAHHGLIRDEAAPLSREAEAKLALEHTRITKAAAWAMALIFLATIGVVPAVQMSLDWQAAQSDNRAAVREGRPAEASLLPKPLDVMEVLPSPQQILEAKSPQAAWQLIPTDNQIKPYEESLQDNSFAVKWTLPRMQNLLLKAGVGNEQAYKGRLINGRHWLHYRPDVDYVTSRGFMEPDVLLVRKRGGDQDSAEVQPDPIQAIVRFQRQLAARGITLILMPTPVKAMMQPETLSTRYRQGQGFLQNPSYPGFLAQLKREKVTLLDTSGPLLSQMQRTGRPQYLETDTHWTPEGMELAAQELARTIRGLGVLPGREPAGYTRETGTVSNLGDIAEMLKMPEDQDQLKPQKVTIHPVRRPDGDLWYPERRASVLLLGDSFSNVYSLDGMNWGASAGLAEQLSFELQQPVDSIINNAGGSYVTRERLVREAGAKRQRLRGKRIVVWQFAMRDLLIGDWKLLDLPPAGTPGQTS